MKLEIKHIAPYLPFDVEVITSFNGIRYNKPRVLNGSDFNIIKKGGAFHKLVLRPLSDLTKEELSDFRFEHHVDCLTNEREHWIEKYGIEKYINETPYGHIQYLLSKHYDIYNLIPQGLAVDINTLA